jgi:hypothetical protein
MSVIETKIVNPPLKEADKCANCGRPATPDDPKSPLKIIDVAFYSVQVHGPRYLMGSTSVPLCDSCAWLMRDEVQNVCKKFTKETINGQRPNATTSGGERLPEAAKGILQDADPLGAGGGEGG